MKHRSSSVIATVLFATLVLSTPAAQAQTPSNIDKAKAEAIAIAEEGDRYLTAGDFNKAIDAFQRADQRFHAPTFLLALADAQVKAKRLLAGRDTLRKIIDEKFASYAPKQFFEAQAKAKAQLDALEPKIPRFLIAVQGADLAQVTVDIDGARVPTQELLKVSQRDPGPVSVDVRAPGKVPVHRDVLLQEGQTERVIVELVDEKAVVAPPVPTAPPAPPAQPPVQPTQAPTAPPPPPTKEPKAEDNSRLPAYILLGVAGVGAGATVFFAVSAAGAKSDYDAAPTQELFDDTERLALMGDIAFGVTALTGALGGYLLWQSTADETSAAGNSQPVLIAPIAGGGTWGGAARVQF